VIDEDLGRDGFDVELLGRPRRLSHRLTSGGQDRRSGCASRQESSAGQLVALIHDAL